MADPQHVEWLLEGVERWNARRQAEPFEPFLMNADLHAEFSKRGMLDPNGRIKLPRINLSDANLIGAKLRNIDFYYADLRRAKLNANLDTVNFGQADLTDAEIMRAYTRNAIFGSATLHNANLVQTNLAHAELEWSQIWTARIFEPGGSTPQSDHEICPGHPIADVSEFLERFRNIERRHSNELTYYFRGENRTDWELRPSVMRYDETAQRFAWRSKEGGMLTELMSRRPEEFANTHSALSQWVVAQHHGLKTRFLDITTDPLVALFNASTDENNRHVPGVVHIFAVPRWLVKPYDDTAVSVVANFAKLDRTDQNTLLTDLTHKLKKLLSLSHEQRTDRTLQRLPAEFLWSDDSHRPVRHAGRGSQP